MLKALSYSLLLLAFISCVSTKIPGEYRSGQNGGSRTLILDSAYRFRYQINEGLSERISKGVWRISNSGHVILESDPDITISNGLAKEVVTGNNGGCWIKVFDMDGKTPLRGLKLKINEIEYVTDSIGEILVNKGFNSIFTVFYLDFQYYYEPKNSNADEIILSLKPFVESVFVMRKEVFQLRRNVIMTSDLVKLKRKGR